MASPKLNRRIEQRFEQVAHRERTLLYIDWARYDLLRKEQSNAMQLLTNAFLEQCIDERIQSLIYIVALLDRTGQVKNVVGRIHHENTHVRARALEVLDNAGNMRINRWVIELIDAHASKRVVVNEEAKKAAGNRALEVIAACLQCAYPWVRTCAKFANIKVGTA